MDPEFREAAAMIRAARRLLVFTGAGVSAESGIPTFRDADGFWNEFPPEEFAHWRGLLSVASKRPKDLARFLHAVIEPVAAARPNAAHHAIAEASDRFGITVVTQNIDGLHQEAGSSVVHEVHGTLMATAHESGRLHSQLTRADLRRVAARLERAGKGVRTLPRILWAVRPLAGFGIRGAYRPKVVLFNDAMAEPDWSRAQQAAERADCVLQIGCSNAVYPAALLPNIAKDNGASVIAVDPNFAAADIWLRGTATDLVPNLLREATQ